MKNIYTLSKDYEELYKHICKGHIIACYVNYNWHDGSPPSRDICTCKKWKHWEIRFSSRGIEYGSVDPFEKKKGSSEKDIFIKTCKILNVEWIVPGQEIGWTGAKIKCTICEHEWVAMFPAELDRIECPNCKNIVRYEILELE